MKKTITFKATPQEEKILTQEAKRAGLSKSDYIRYKLFSAETANQITPEAITAKQAEDNIIQELKNEARNTRQTTVQATQLLYRFIRYNHEFINRLLHYGSFAYCYADEYESENAYNEFLKRINEKVKEVMAGTFPTK